MITIQNNKKLKKLFKNGVIKFQLVIKSFKDFLKLELGVPVND